MDSQWVVVMRRLTFAGLFPVIFDNLRDASAINLSVAEPYNMGAGGGCKLTRDRIQH